LGSGPANPQPPPPPPPPPHTHKQVREEHLDLARDAGTERAKVEFVQVN